MREVHQWSCKCFDTSKAHFRTPLFAIVLQTIFRQMFKLVDFQLDQYVLWSSFSFSSVTIWSLCALQTSFNQHGSSVSSFDKDVLEHTELRVHQYEQGIQRLSNPHYPPLTGQPMTFHGSSLVFMGFPNDGIAVPLGPLWFLMVPPILKTFLVQRS